ncbi:MAG: exodeoxyribonuclease VII small subunit [Gemmatimonadota bacterium]
MSDDVKSPVTSEEGDIPDGEAASTLEGRLRRLEEILGLLESDDVELERALTLFEEGVRLVREAEGLLARTELRVEELLTGGETRELQEEDDG